MMMEEIEIIIRFKLTSRIISNALISYTYLNRIAYSILLGLLGVSFIALPILEFIMSGTVVYLFSYTKQLLVIIFFSLLLLFLEFFRIKNSSFRKNALLLNTFIFSNHTIASFDEDVEFKCKWSTVSKIEEDKHYYFISYIPFENLFHIIPKDAFETKDHEIKFRDLVKMKSFEIKNIQYGLKGWRLSLLVFVVCLIFIAIRIYIAFL